jgi:hypothetical protein
VRIGRHLHELWGHRIGFALALAVALLAAARMAGFGLLPPHAPQAGRGLAATHMLVDTPESTTVDLRQSTYDIEGLTNRALLVANAMASPVVRADIARRAGVPVDAIRMTTPLNAEYPEGVAESGGPQGAEGLVPASPYRLDVQSNLTVPLVDLNTEAPTADAAVKLANAAAAGLDAYLATAARDGATPPDARISAVQLGRAQPLPASSGAGPVFTALVFALVFAAGGATVLFLARVRRGWHADGKQLRTSTAH